MPKQQRWILCSNLSLTELEFLINFLPFMTAKAKHNEREIGNYIFSWHCPIIRNVSTKQSYTFSHGIKATKLGSDVLVVPPCVTLLQSFCILPRKKQYVAEGRINDFLFSAKYFWFSQDSKSYRRSKEHPGPGTKWKSKSVMLNSFSTLAGLAIFRLFAGLIIKFLNLTRAEPLPLVFTNKEETGKNN